MPVKFTVSQINNNIDNLIKQRFSNIIIEGEISSFNISPSGHSYFTLKDEKSEIKAKEKFILSITLVKQI